MLAGCASTPKPADPPRLRAALEAESDGAKRYGRGDYGVAERRFDDAIRIFASIDDASGSARNRLHLARTRLAQGRAAAALDLLDATPAAVDPGLTLDSLLLKAQALLGLARAADAQQSLASAAGYCGPACPQAASLSLLQARAALDGSRAADALAHAEAALKLLRDRDEPAETGNAWRLIAAARLAGGDAAAALPAAQAALDIDRRLAVPEKIARDWLLIGNIHRSGSSGASRQETDGEAAAAYRRALGVANAAGLAEISTIAEQALKNDGMNKKP
jgi:tetratricopeptide (TPR) repeat protein